jgi:transcription initiation factor TFIIIB Brf1 subunit/transcription initiation factor TFIIB
MKINKQYVDNTKFTLNMSEFALFEQALVEYETTRTSEDEISSGEDSDILCDHSDLVTENGITSCLECGEQIQRTIMHEKEWRFYGHSDSKRSSDPNRVQMRKSEDRNINKDVENMGFSETIVAKANEIYTQVTKGQIFRGDSRKAVVFACIYHAYKMAGKCQTPKNLMETFGLNKKSSLKGLKIVNVNAAKDSPIHTTSLTAVHHIYDVMDKFSATPAQKSEVILLYRKTKNRSSKLNRARPQSVASALTYYWICKKKMDISLKKFAQKADLSELTINKNAKEVAIVLGTPDVV